MTDAQRAGKGMGAVIDRYSYSWTTDLMSVTPAGKYVLYTDHAAAMDTLAAKLRAADALAEAALQEVHQLHGTATWASPAVRASRIAAALAAYKQAGMGGES